MYNLKRGIALNSANIVTSEFDKRFTGLVGCWTYYFFDLGNPAKSMVVAYSV